ncbi:WD40 repeat domain-containing protein [Streptomyces spectabilis]|uniref:WD40 repeat domain-containing protein n=1 Tax=Streptomyces spectabilis TaxID=68270 RepID=A0A516R964_STRST|nr:WD40 repeat domain-containing protein [Streptomyces spectabilis]QDQ12191.1 WD40 repeat domain-containing protein [Streptomyces spectabilis]
MRSSKVCAAGAAAVVAAVLVASGGPALAADKAGNDGFTIEDPRITESSGLVASRAHPGVYWTHNDQDSGAYLYAVDSRTGRTVARITMTGVGKPRDVEAISMGPDGSLYVGDIGDNLGGKWSYVWVYKLPEPKELKDQSVRATQYVVKYADGPRDAEALMVHPRTGRVYIADKKEDGGSLYEGPARLSTSGTNVFRRVASTDLWVTDGAFSPDGKHLALRGYFGGVGFTWRDGGRIKREGRLRVPLQRQGESVAYSPDGSRLMYGTEGEQSDVEAVEVKGAGGGGGSSADGGGSGDGSGGFTGGATKGAVVLGAVVLAVLGLKRLFRRG